MDTRRTLLIRSKPLAKAAIPLRYWIRTGLFERILFAGLAAAIIRCRLKLDSARWFFLGWQHCRDAYQYHSFSSAWSIHKRRRKLASGRVLSSGLGSFAIGR